MAAALLSPRRIRKNRLRWRRCASARTVYAYVSGDPVNRVDPLGLTECDVVAARDFARMLVKREGLQNIDVPDYVSKGELDGSHAWGQTEMGYVFRPVTLDNVFWSELDEVGAIVLMGTYLHESMHRAESILYPTFSEARKDADHKTITSRANTYRHLFGNEFLKYRESACGCQK